MGEGSRSADVYPTDTECMLTATDEVVAAILEDLHGLLDRVSTHHESLDADVLALEQRHGDAVYGELLHLLSHLRFAPLEAKPHWKRILEHRATMQKMLDAPVDLRVALVSYFVEVNQQLKNPKVIEMQLFERERASACRDHLTGLYNHRMFREHLEREVHHGLRSKKPVSLVMIDVDDFKQYNDRLGHEAGNEALSTLARLLVGTLRTSDIAARYGGEEFALILPATPKTSARLVAERTRENIEEHVFRGESFLPEGRLTVSMGVATFPADADDGAELVRHSDRALYVAKSAGKNQVVLYGESQRSYGRVHATLHGVFHVQAETAHPLQTINVSEGGVLFRAEHEVKPGRLIELTLRDEARGEIHAAGRVVYVESAADGTFRTAVHITDAHSIDRSRLAKLVREAADLGLAPSDPENAET